MICIHEKEEEKFMNFFPFLAATETNLNKHLSIKHCRYVKLI